MKKQRVIYVCGNCGKRINKKDKFCLSCCEYYNQKDIQYSKWIHDRDALIRSLREGVSLHNNMAQDAHNKNVDKDELIASMAKYLQGVCKKC